LASIDRRYKELCEMAKIRKQRLLDALSLYKLFTEADGVEQWIAEKEKMLGTMVPGKDIEDCEIMKHRFDGFDREMNANASRVAVVNQLARQLLHVDHPGSDDIVARQNNLNTKWSSLREKSEMKREELNSAHGVQTYHIECRETVTWIEDKMRVLEQTDELKMDLTGIMTLQRKLSGMERDLAAIQAKLDALEEESEKIASSHPEEAVVVQQRTNKLREIWDQLTEMLKERDAKLEEAGDLHRFLKDLDHFQAWLSKTESDIANEDSPASLAEAEKLLSNHQQIREEIDSYVNDYSSMMEYGEKITADPTTFDDPQYMFLRERLKALKDGWEEVHQMWENRQTLLSQSLNLQMFNRDAKQAEVLLSSQDHLLSKDETPANLEQAELLMKRHEALLTTMDANDDKINGVISFADRLLQEEHFAADKISKKLEEVSERRNNNRAAAMEQLERIRDQHLLHTFLQDCEELHDWIQVRNVQVQEDTYRSSRTIHSKWTRHQAFQSEIQSNKERLDKVRESGDALLRAKPEMSELVAPKLDDLSTKFTKLEKDTEEKGERLFDAKRAVLYDQSCDDIDSFARDIETQIQTEPTEVLKDLTSVKIMMQKQQLIETQFTVKSQQLSELDNQAGRLAEIEPEKMEERQEQQRIVAERFGQMKAPIEARKKELMKKKETFQFKRDVEDENSWADEKMQQAASHEIGNTLGEVSLLLKKVQMMQAEIANHEPRFNATIEAGEKMISENHPESEKFERDLTLLAEKWARLAEMVEARKQKLLVNERVQQFLFDANEAESWMSEQELYMMVEDRGKDEFSAQNLMKKHGTLESTVEDYAETIRQLGETARQLIADEHPKKEAIAVRIGQVDKLYAGLKDLATERRAKLDDALKLFMLNREVDDLEQWIAEREVVAGSHELGQDYDHVSLLVDRFREFARDTETIGSERVTAVNEIADSLISVGHTDAALIAQWKDSLNDAWADLNELMDTRSQMLQASQELHKYFHDCKDVLSRILEKQNSMSDELGRDGASVSALQRKHQNFLQDLHSLQSQVEAIREDSGKLQAAYAGEKAMEITNREREVLRAWMELQAMGDGRKDKLNDTGNLFRFFAMVRSLIMWMEDLMRQMSTSEKPRDVSGVELLMNNHQGHKAEIDAREDNFGDLYSLGKELLSMGHYASNEIKEKLRELTDKRNGMIHRWEERWEHLQLILEVYQFARDAAVAEAWLIAQDPYLKSDEFGQSIDEVENLIKKHEAFEKAAAAQEERFAALERLTTFELKDMKRRQEEEQRAHADTIERQKQERYRDSRDQPDTRSDTSSIRDTTDQSSREDLAPGRQGSARSREAAVQQRPRTVQVQEAAMVEHRPPHSPQHIQHSAKESGDGELEGMLVRKHEWESTTKKASNRSWEKICVVLKEQQLCFYKDQKAYKNHPEETFKGEPAVDLINCTAEVATDYTKKKYVFRLRLSNGGYYLFQAADEDQMNLWVNGINSQAAPQEAETDKSRTLPPGSEKKDEPKRRSFFTLKKK